MLIIISLQAKPRAVKHKHETKHYYSQISVFSPEIMTKHKTNSVDPKRTRKVMGEVRKKFLGKMHCAVDVVEVKLLGLEEVS